MASLPLPIPPKPRNKLFTSTLIALMISSTLLIAVASYVFLIPVVTEDEIARLHRSPFSRFLYRTYIVNEYNSYAHVSALAEYMDEDSDEITHHHYLVNTPYDGIYLLRVDAEANARLLAGNTLRLIGLTAQPHSTAKNLLEELLIEEYHMLEDEADHFIDTLVCVDTSVSTRPIWIALGVLALFVLVALGCLLLRMRSQKK